MGTKERIEFCAEFERRFGDKVKQLALVRLYGDRSSIANAGITLPPGKKDLWGLLIFGEQHIHFFAHASESFFVGMFRTASGGKAPEEQYLCITGDQLENIRMPERRKGFISFLSTGPASVSVSFRNENGQPATLDFELSGNEKEVYTCAREMNLRYCQDLRL